jgi:ABC-type transport system involved in multi-copper enzyme maturation permease subunit
LPSRNFLVLLSKEWRELSASRAFWLLLLMTGPLVGQGFIRAVELYGEASGAGGGASALAQGLTPLDGILVPTFGAYDLAATFLFPFVAIRMVSAEKESGALKLMLQLPGSLTAKMAAKGLALLAGWLVALLPGLLALLLWASYGGHLYAPETLNLIAGHILRAMLGGGVAVAAAALAESTASAAIVTLGITVGTWALDFIAAGRGGLLRQMASYTPTAALRFFEQGLLRSGTLLAMLAISVAGFAWAAVWLRTGWSFRRRTLASGVLVVALAVTFAVAAGTQRASWDLSENRRNSFPSADEDALARLDMPLRVTVYLSPEDPRLTDLEQSVLVKLRRVLADVEVDYAAGSRTGLFENAEEHYGEIWYEMGGRRVLERSTIEPVVLDRIYKLAGVAAPARTRDEEFSGYPLSARPSGAALIFYGLWPAVVALVWWWWLTRR